MKIMPKPSITNRRFVNVYELDYKTSITNSGRVDQINDVKCVATHESKNYKEAKSAFEIIRSAENFKDRRFSVQLQDFDGKIAYNNTF